MSMKKEKKMKEVSVALNIGTGSVGYAVINSPIAGAYDIVKYKGNDAWGSILYDEGELCADRRGYRSSRRNLNRKKWRVDLLQEIFADEIAKIDKRFFIRLEESCRWRDEVSDKNICFDEENYTDKNYYQEYPTIHHLIYDLMRNKRPHDIRLVYLACSWLLTHRGHFNSPLDINRLEEITGINQAYNEFMAYFVENGYDKPWNEVDSSTFGQVFRKKLGVKDKFTELKNLLLDGKKPSQACTESFPYSQEGILKLLSGGKYEIKKLFGKEEYDEIKSVSLGMDDESNDKIAEMIGDDMDLITILNKLYDWYLLVDILEDTSGNTCSCISEAKISIYEQHKDDLKTLKYIIKKYTPEKYNEIFREIHADNYIAYSHHIDKNMSQEKYKYTNIELFSDYISKTISKIQPDQSDMERFCDMNKRLALHTFMPKQKTTDNRVIPHQLYEYELQKILKNASCYLPFLNEIEDGLSNAEKIMELFLFKIPYFVGPLNNHSPFAWVKKRSNEKITPWNFKDVIDEDESEKAFIRRMTNHCAYIHGASVLPKHSLYYQKFTVLNEINSIRIHGKKISVSAKQGLFNDVFKKKKNIKKSDIETYLIKNGYMNSGEENAITGVDTQIHSMLSSYLHFRSLLESETLSVEDVEKIIERSAYAEDKSRLLKWLKKNYAELSEDDMKYICKCKIEDFGKLSGEFLYGIEGVDKKTGEITTILQTMWDKNLTMMEILYNSRYTFAEEINKMNAEYFNGKELTIEDVLDEYHASNTTRRAVYRVNAVLKDIEKNIGKPSKIFIGSTKGMSTTTVKTKSRYEQLVELYNNISKNYKAIDISIVKKELESLGDDANNRLQSDAIFLYFMQLGICAYTGEKITLNALSGRKKKGDIEEYNIDHIYPQSVVKDDSIANNKVLVLSKINGRKDNDYPIEHGIRKKMLPMWEQWKSIGIINDEKYNRLTRNEPFSIDERKEFTSRQLTLTSQLTKITSEVLKNRYRNMDIKIIPVSYRLLSDFRKEFDLPKSRTYNDLHNATDAYLEAVVGDVYYNKFFKKPFDFKSKYSIKLKAIFQNQQKEDDEIIWNGKSDLIKVQKIAQKTSAHIVKYSSFSTGKLFDVQLVSRKPGLVEFKKGMPTERYGGYNKPKIMFFIPVKYSIKKVENIIILPVELLYGKQFLEDKNFAIEYSHRRLEKILGKTIDNFSFPLGMRPLKMNTMLSLDGFRVCITGSSSRGKCLIVQPMMQFVSDPSWIQYLKYLENFVRKLQKDPKRKYCEKYDKITKEKNSMLYDLYIEKMQYSIYTKRQNIEKTLQTLLNGKSLFEQLDINEQCLVLLNIHSVFGRMTNGCDLTLIGGKKSAAATSSFSAIMSNWKKKYSDVRIIDQSPAGLIEKVSNNLLKLIDD